MTVDNYFYDIDGEPLTGKIPIQVRVFGEGDLGPARAAANNALHAFLATTRLSLGQSHGRTFQLPGATMKVRSIFGAVTVELFLSGEPEEDSVFYGGILLKLVIVGQSQLVQFGGGGRPAVPGTSDADRTEWLIFHIDRNAALDNKPIGSGAIKIFRIHEALAGGLCEVDPRPGQYLVSAKLVDVGAGLSTGLPEFYVCGRRMQHVPALTFGYVENQWPLRPPFGVLYGLVRIVTAFKEIPKFETAGETEACIIVAAMGKLFALNTKSRGTSPAQWVLLDALPEPNFNTFYDLNDYGTTITHTTAGTNTIVTCSGSNGAGVCSGFTVEFNSDTGFITGVLAPMIAPLQLYPGQIVERDITVSTNMTRAKANYSIWDPFWGEGLPPPGRYTSEPIFNYIDNATYSRADVSYFRNYDPNLELAKDKISGDPVPPATFCYETEVDTLFSSSITASDPVCEADVFPNEDELLDRGPFLRTLRVASERTQVKFKALAWARPGLENQFEVHEGGLSHTSPEGPPYHNQPNVFTDTSTWTPGPTGLQLGEDPARANYYSAADRHTWALAFRVNRGHTCSYHESGDVRPRRSPPQHWLDGDGTPTRSGSRWVEYSALRLSYKLCRMPQNEAVYSYEDFTAEFDTAGSGAFGPQAIYADKNEWAPNVEWGKDDAGQDFWDWGWPGTVPGNQRVVGGFPALANFAGSHGLYSQFSEYGQLNPAQYSFHSALGGYPTQWFDVWEWFFDPTVGSPAVADFVTRHPRPSVARSFSISWAPSSEVNHPRQDYANINPLSVWNMRQHMYDNQGVDYINPGLGLSWWPYIRDELEPSWPDNVIIEGPKAVIAGGFDAPIPHQPINAAGDLIYRDLRTGGFIAQSRWGLRNAAPQWLNGLNPASGSYVRAVTVIGNDWGSVPLEDVLNEWKMLGSLEHPDLPTVPDTEITTSYVQLDAADNSTEPFTIIPGTQLVSLI